MNPLILFAGSLVPAILDVVVGKRAEAVSEAVVAAVTKATGISDPAKAQEKLAQDPALATQLRLDLAEIAAKEKRDAFEAEAKARQDQLDREIAIHKAKLDAAHQSSEAEFKQREIDFRETQGARQMLIDLKDGYVRRTPMVLSYIVTIGFFVVILLFVTMKNSLEAPKPAEFPKATLDILGTLKPDQIAAMVAPRSDFVIQIINICVGALAAAFATVMSFWLGSSQSSRNKDAMVANLQERSAENQERQSRANIDITRQAVDAVKGGGGGSGGQDFQKSTGGGARDTGGQIRDGERSGSAPVFPPDETGGAAPETKQDPVPKPQGDPVRTDPATPLSNDALAQALPALTKPHKHFEDGVSWALTPAGIAIEGAAPSGTPGKPTTVAEIWRNFGPLCAASAKQYGVPVELIVATIFTESSGKPNARRAEPQINDESVGLMQTLVTTARSATGRKTLRGDDLLDPRTSIDAGTAYIALQRSSTMLDPPMVAAAYNAGSIKRDDADANRWRMHCFPRHTGIHIDKFVARFNDAMLVSARDGWSRETGCPSFAAALGATPGGAGSSQDDSGMGGPGSASRSSSGGKIIRSNLNLDINAPGFPPKPAFIGFLGDSQREARFGRFDFVPDPSKENGDGIRILGGWEANNIETFVIPIQPHPVLGKTFRVTFHKEAKEQLIDLWLAWENAGLLDRVISWEGAFVPRFQRSDKNPKPLNRPLSNHSFGTAFDINAAQNRLNKEPAAIGKKGCVRELVPLANAHGFYWGGHFNSRKDGMHFEVGKLL